MKTAKNQKRGPGKATKRKAALSAQQTIPYLVMHPDGVCHDTAGVSHCGIYVGDNMMIHCGDPISYANLNTSYWQSHFYAYGRLP